MNIYETKLSKNIIFYESELLQGVTPDPNDGSPPLASPKLC